MKSEMKQSVFLCGFMGVGKSTVGKLLSEKLQVPFYDTDDMITESNGATVAELFALGEENFRGFESEEIQKIQFLPPGIVALGGGALKDPVNLLAIEKAGVLIYLGAAPETIHGRLEQSNTRPLLAGYTGEARLIKIARLLEEREIVYKSADVVIMTDGKSPEAVCVEIIQSIQKGKS